MFERKLPAYEIADKIRDRAVSPVAVVESYLEAIEDHNDALNSFITVMDEGAREAARKAERELESGGSTGPLHGVPIAVKDNIDVAGVPTTNGATFLTDNIAEEDDVIVQRLKEAGAIVLGKTNLPEFATGPGTDNKLIGEARNPFDLDENAGGSSGGSANAVAAGLAPLAHGTDGGGSIRNPSCACAVFGFKPTARRIPLTRRPDIYGYGSPFSHNGPITRSVKDAALLMDVMAGYHPKDPLSLPMSNGSFVSSIEEETTGWDIAYVPHVDGGPLDPEVEAHCDDAISTVRTFATVDQVNPDIDLTKSEVDDTFATLSHTRQAANVEHLKNSRGIDILGEDKDLVRSIAHSRIKDGLNYSGVDIRRADAHRTHLYDALQNILNEYDAIIAPSLIVPTRIYSRICQETRSLDETVTVAGVELNATYAYRNFHLFNMTGHPAATVPTGLDEDGLPTGIQIIGERYDDETVLSVSAAFEEERPWHELYDQVAI